MNSDQDKGKQLEQDVQRLLQDLPEFAAPPAVLSRTMAALDRQPVPRHHIQPWAKWPLSARVLFLALGMATMGLAVFELKALMPEMTTSAIHLTAPLKAGFACFWNAVCALAGAFGLALGQMSRAWIFAGIAMAVVAWIACIGFGTVFVRLASSRAERNL